MVAWRVFLSVFFALAAVVQGTPAFDDGVRFYKETEYELAMVQFQATSTRPDLTDADRALVLLWIGLSHAGLGNSDAAQRSFQQALEADPAVVLPPALPPAIVAQIEAQRVEVVAAKKAAPTTTLTTPTAPAASSDAPVLGIGVSAAGGALIVVGGVMAALSAGALATANDPTQFQSDAKSALDTANGAAVAAGVLLPLGVAVTAGGVALVVLE